MFDEIGNIIFDNEIVATASDFNMGIEVEMHRVDAQAHLSTSPYPKAIGNQRKNHFIKNDFLQMQTEIITPTTSHSIDAMHYLMQLNDTLRNALANGEMLWALSMPPVLPEDKSEIAISDVSPEQKAYYEKWAEINGFESGIPTGVHLNISISQQVLETLWWNFKSSGKFTEAELKNYLYEKIVQGFIRYEWLLTYLFGNSPIAERNFFKPGEGPTHPVRSIRESHFGLGNKVKGDYSSVPNYVAKIEAGIADGTFLSEAEFHGSIRFKTSSGQLQDALTDGVDYIELRMLDLDPTTSVGVRTSTIRFIRMMLTYFLMTDSLTSPDKMPAFLAEGMAMNEAVSLENPKTTTEFVNQGQRLLAKLQDFGATIHWGPEYQEVLEMMQNRMDNTNLTPSANLTDHIVDDSLVQYALQVGARYQNRAHRNPNPFKGFENNPDMPVEKLREQLFDKSNQPSEFDE